MPSEKETAKAAAARQAEERRIMAADMAAHEKRNNIVPGTAQYRGTPGQPGSGPFGGTEYEGKARMAIARQAAIDAGHVTDPDNPPDDSEDAEALRRFPDPMDGITGRRRTA